MKNYGYPISLVAAMIAAPALADELPERVTQQVFMELVKAGDVAKAYEIAFEVGDELFEHRYTAAEGVGANVGQGQRFSLVPRADLKAEGEWGDHFPRRVTGPNAQSCDVCHGTPVGDGSGFAVMNNIRDPLHKGDPKFFINRQPPHIFGIGALQLLAEEMTTELRQQRDNAVEQAAGDRGDVTAKLNAKGIEFGVVVAKADGSIDYSGLEGIDEDLQIKPMEWKGVTSFVRAFVRDAAHNELGLQAVEFSGDDHDGDGDGIKNELSVGDITAITIYQAAQPRPTTKVELAELGLIEPLSKQEIADINRGEVLFAKTGCASCHTPVLTLNNSVFSEPSQHPDYRDRTFPAGQDSYQRGVTPEFPITFDLTKDLPDNIITTKNGETFGLGNFRTNRQGLAMVELFSDLKRHDMGPGLAEAIDEKGKGASVFITQELWGVGSTPPYLHDGRATTLAEAIDWHRGDSEFSRQRFNELPKPDRTALLAYLDNLVLYKKEEE